MSRFLPQLISYRLLLGVLVLCLAVLVSFSATGDASALNPQRDLCEGSGGVWSGNECRTPGETRTVDNLFGTLVDVLLFVIGAVSVLMLIFGGFKYATSNGEQSAITSAKNTILYAIAGLVIAFAGYAVVTFLTDEFVSDRVSPGAGRPVTPQ